MKSELGDHVRMKVGLSIVVLMLSSCATGYHPLSFSGGYSELRLSARGWQVRFAGNGATAPERAHSFALRRAAELTLESGYQAFYVASESQTNSQSSFSSPQTCTYSGGIANCSGGGDTIVNKPGARIDITMVTRQEAAQTPPRYLVYDARVILGQLASK